MESFSCACTFVERPNMHVAATHANARAVKTSRKAPHASKTPPSGQS